MVADDYAVEEGFGDYYLELRDRAAEEREREADDEERRRRETPPLILLRDALASGNDFICRDVFHAARKSPELLAQCVEQLFSGTTDPQRIAFALRLALDDVVLPPARWKIVAEGGGQLGNNAIRNFALARAQG